MLPLDHVLDLLGMNVQVLPFLPLGQREALPMSGSLKAIMDNLIGTYPPPSRVQPVALDPKPKLLPKVVASWKGIHWVQKPRLEEVPIVVFFHPLFVPGCLFIEKK